MKIKIKKPLPPKKELKDIPMGGCFSLVNSPKTVFMRTKTSATPFAGIRLDNGVICSLPDTHEVYYLRDVCLHVAICNQDVNSEWDDCDD